MTLPTITVTWKEGQGMFDARPHYSRLPEAGIWQRVADGNATGQGSCCWIGCPNPAEFQIHGGSGHPEDSTLGCEFHVGQLLGTPTWAASDNTHWVVAPWAGWRWFL